MLILFHLVPLQSLSSRSSFSFNLTPATVIQPHRWFASLLHHPSSFYGIKVYDLETNRFVLLEEASEPSVGRNFLKKVVLEHLVQTPLQVCPYL
ncbi:hypothetical protein RYX36_008452 [Vicia faba]